DRRLAARRQPLAGRPRHGGLNRPRRHGRLIPPGGVAVGPTPAAACRAVRRHGRTCRPGHPPAERAGRCSPRSRPRREPWPHLAWRMMGSRTLIAIPDAPVPPTGSGCTVIAGSSPRLRTPDGFPAATRADDSPDTLASHASWPDTYASRAWHTVRWRSARGEIWLRRMRLAFRT